MKYKYYFTKPRSEIVKDILSLILTGGAIAIASTSPYFVTNFFNSFANWKKHKKRTVSDAFHRLEKQGCIEITKKNHQIYIHLTEQGRKMAGWLQIDALKIKNPQKWDRKWRMVIFDIAHLKKKYRDAFRGKLKELGFYPLQKSVWVHPYECKDEVDLLRDFFGLTKKEVQLIVTEDIEQDEHLLQYFKV